MRWLAVLASLVLLSGCVGTELQAPRAQTQTLPAIDAPALRRARTLPDCPPDTSSAVPVSGGLPDLTLACIGGDQPVRVAALKGPMLVNLWAAWCPPCRQEGPHLTSFAAAAAGKVTLVGVDTADPDPALAAQFAQAVGWRYMQLQDPSHTLSDALGLKGLPVTLFVNAQGKITYTHVGAFGSEQQIRDLVAQHLAVRL